MSPVHSANGDHHAASARAHRLRSGVAKTMTPVSAPTSESSRIRLGSWSRDTVLDCTERVRATTGGGAGPPVHRRGQDELSRGPVVRL